LQTPTEVKIRNPQGSHLHQQVTTAVIALYAHIQQPNHV